MLLESDESVFVKAARQRMRGPECGDEVGMKRFRIATISRLTEMTTVNGGGQPPS